MSERLGDPLASSLPAHARQNNVAGGDTGQHAQLISPLASLSHVPSHPATPASVHPDPCAPGANPAANRKNGVIVTRATLRRSNVFWPKYFWLTELVN